MENVLKIDLKNSENISESITESILNGNVATIYKTHKINLDDFDILVEHKFAESYFNIKNINDDIVYLQISCGYDDVYDSETVVQVPLKTFDKLYTIVSVTPKNI